MTGRTSDYNVLLYVSVGVVFTVGLLSGLCVGWLIWA